MSNTTKTMLDTLEKWGMVVDRMNAYQAAVIEAADLVGKGKTAELEQKIRDTDNQCQQQANEVACWAARGLKQVYQCEILTRRLDRLLKKIDDRSFPKNDITISLHSDLAVSRGEVELVCLGHFQSAIHYVQTIQQLGLIDNQPAKQ